MHDRASTGVAHDRQQQRSGEFVGASRGHGRFAGQEVPKVAHARMHGTIVRTWRRPPGRRALRRSGRHRALGGRMGIGCTRHPQTCEMRSVRLGPAAQCWRQSAEHGGRGMQVQGAGEKARRAVQVSGALEAQLLHNRKSCGSASWGAKCFACGAPLRSPPVCSVPTGSSRLSSAVPAPHVSACCQGCWGHASRYQRPHWPGPGVGFDSRGPHAFAHMSALPMQWHDPSAGVAEGCPSTRGPSSRSVCAQSAGLLSTALRCHTARIACEGTGRRGAARVLHNFRKDGRLL